VLDRFARHEPAAALDALDADGGAIFALARGFVAGRVRDARRRGLVPVEIDPEHLAELAIRLGFSFLLIPGTALPVEDDRRMRELVRELLAPLA
jgi:hypothetical protein